MTAPRRIVFAGTPEFSVPALDALQAAGHTIVAVYTQPDRPAGRGRELAAGAVKQRARQLGLPIEQPATLKAPAAQATLANYAPDVMVVVAYGLLLPQAVLDVPPLGCLNIHASLLPRWRGAAPIQRAILAGDTRTGVTIMKMDAGLDTGPELLRRELAIGPHETSASLHEKLAALGAHAIVEAIDGWAAGTLSLTPQPAAAATYAAKIRKGEARIDWTAAASAIDRQVRAFNPWPVAESTLGGEQVRIWEAQPVASEPVPSGKTAVATSDGVATQPALPGEVLPAPGRLLVATGDGVLELLRVQLPGRKSLAARDFLHARRLDGARFGDAS